MHRDTNKIGGWELLLLLMSLVVLSLSFTDDAPAPQPVNGYTYPHMARPLSDAEFLDGAPVVNAAEAQETSR